MGHCTGRRRARQIEALRARFAQADDGLPFADVLPAARVDRVLREEGARWREQVFTPVLTLWTFLTQVISADGSCRAAVARVLAWLVGRGEPPCSPKTDPYCKARKRLPEGALRRLARETGQSLQQAAPAGWRWKGRRVKVADGTTVSMPDTAANQAAYPQSRSQAAGLGYPVARVVAVFCLACGAVLDAALGPWRGKRTGENTLLRGLGDSFGAGDVVLADGQFAGYFDIAFFAGRGADVLVPLHHQRRCDFRRGRRLGPGDHVVEWRRPKRPDWMTADDYAAVPQCLLLREVQVLVPRPGRRPRLRVLVTTLLEPAAYRSAELAALYAARWHAELDLRCLKTTLGMDVLRCKSPGMVRKELWAHLLAYNLIRAVMARAADALGAGPRELSFKATLQMLTAFAERLEGGGAAGLTELYDWLLLGVAAHQVGDRPGRLEPRALKRRAKPYDLLKRPRDQARAALQAKR
jgi:hypothetical protein